MGELVAYGALACNVVASIGLVVLNKLLFVQHSFSFGMSCGPDLDVVCVQWLAHLNAGTLLLVFHQITTWLILEVACMLGVFTPLSGSGPRARWVRGENGRGNHLY